MDQTPTISSTPQPTEQHQAPPRPLPASASPSPSPLPPLSSSSSPSSLPSSSSSAIAPSPNPNPSPNSSITQTQQSSAQSSQVRPPFNRPWQPSSHFSHFSSSHLSSMPPPHSSASSSSPSTPPVPPFSSSASSPLATPLAQRGGMAIGVPAHQASPPAPPTSFSSLSPPRFGQQFGGMARGAATAPESASSPGTSQVRPLMQGIQGMGTMGSFSSGTQMRPGGISVHHQQRPMQSSVRAQSTPNSQSPTSQSFQGNGMLRVSSIGSPVSPAASASQSQFQNQPWLSSGSQGKPPLPPPSFRPQTNLQSLQQRAHIPQQQHQTSPTRSQQLVSSSQQPQPPSPGHSPQEILGQQFPHLRSITQQLQISRSPGLGNQKPSQTVGQLSPLQSGPTNRPQSAETGEMCNRILSKRSIQELVTQIDPSERLDPEVEDILVDIADEFVESITTFGCSLAKHRKSSTLEAKDILVHLEKTWNMMLPGFGGDEIKTYRKPFTTDIHRERLAAIKKSINSAEATNIKTSGPAIANAKGHPVKAPMNNIGSPNAPKA